MKKGVSAWNEICDTRIKTMDEENGSNNFLPKDFSSPKRGSSAEQSTAENKVENLSLDSGPESNVLEAGFRTNVIGASYNRSTMDSTQDSSLGLHNLMENSSGQVTVTIISSYIFFAENSRPCSKGVE